MMLNSLVANTLITSHIEGKSVGILQPYAKVAMSKDLFEHKTGMYDGMIIAFQISKIWLML
jgi:hypothetical protein